MTNWLVYCVAERYMVAPYNVRYFQVWNELKGYYDPVSNGWDYKSTLGNTNGYNAQHGYTCMYNQVYQTLTNVAGTWGIAASNLYIGSPYVVMQSGSAANLMSNPSTVTVPCGVLDQRALIGYWPTNNVVVGFVCEDGGSDNTWGGEITNLFTCCSKFSAVNNWIREQLGGNEPPIVWAEWYNYNGGDTNNDFNNALASYSTMQQLDSGAMLTPLWVPNLQRMPNRPSGPAPVKAVADKPHPGIPVIKRLISYLGRG